MDCTSAPALVAVAHGSRDPRSAATITRLVEEVRRQAPGLDARASFLDLSAPRVPEALAAAAADGHRSAVVVPLLLGHAYHARVDLPGLLAAATRTLPGLDVTTAAVLGREPRGPAPAWAEAAGPAPVRSDAARIDAALIDAGRIETGGIETGGIENVALRRLAEVAGRLDDPGLGVVLAAVGSSHAPANAAVQEVASGWAARFGWAGASAAFATATTPTVPDAVARLRASGAQRVVVAQWVLAPGLIPDRIAAAAASVGVPVAEPLGPDPDVARAVLARYAAAAGARQRAAA